MQLSPSSRTDTEMYLGILIKETLLKRLDTTIAKTMDINNLEEEPTAAEQCEEALCHMHARVRIALALRRQNIGVRSSSTQVDSAKHNHHELAHYALPISPKAAN